ncbi:MAG TPA: GAF domain-containing protein [Desulfomonilaceae bacterium]|nr:GAF domain-containing protein [Desulfomonilaceae bacterium]
MEGNDYFKTFCRVSRAFGTTLGKQELLDLIVRSAVETMRGKASCLFLADEDQDVFVPVASHGLSENYLHAAPMRAKAVVEDILKGGYLVIKDATADPRLENREAKKAEGIASILVVPVILMDKAIGVLSLYSSETRDFSQKEIDFLQALAEHGGMAIHHARLFERLVQNARLFYEFASNVNSSLEIKKILHIMTADIADVFGIKGVAIRLLNKDTEELDLMASYGLSEAFLYKGRITSETGVARCLQGETVVVNTEDNTEYQDEARKEGIASMLCVPITAGNEVIGMMKLCSETKRQFPEEMIQLVNALAHQGGLAIQNASRYLLLQEDKKNLEQDIWSHRSWF